MDHSPPKNHIDKKRFNTQEKGNHINVQDKLVEKLISTNLSIGKKMSSNCLTLKLH